MAINFTTFEGTLQTKLDNVTDPKEMLLLGKAVESTVGNITLQSIQEAGDAELADIAAAGDAELADIAAAVATEVASIVDGAPDAMNTLNEIAAALNDDPDFYNTVMVKTAPVLAGNLDGAGYTYTDLNPEVSTATVSTTQVIDVTSPMHHFTMSAATAFSGVNLGAGKTCMMMLDTSASAYTPTWSSDIKFPAETEPTWADYRYWMISFTCLDGTTMFASAQGYTV